MPASPKPPRTPPKPKRRIVRNAPLKRSARPNPISDRRRMEIRTRTDVTRPGVLRRDGHRCRACGAAQSPGYRMLEVHEEPPRSLGGDPTNPFDCITLCRLSMGGGCHPAMKSHGANRITIEKGPDGCNAPVTFRQGGREWQG